MKVNICISFHCADGVVEFEKNDVEFPLAPFPGLVLTGPDWDGTVEWGEVDFTGDTPVTNITIEQIAKNETREVIKKELHPRGFEMIDSVFE